MRTRTLLSPAVLIALTGAGVLALLMPQTLDLGGNASAAVAAPPPYINVTGIVRDFSRDHPDFDVVPTGGYGHFAGNIDLNEGVDNRPVFVGSGFKVATQWTDRDVTNIAPHLYQAAGFGGGVEVAVSNPGEIIDQSTFRTYDSTQGPYGGGNSGPAPTWATGSPMPVLSEPTGLPPWVQNVTYSGAGTVTLSQDVHCDNFTISNEKKLNIDGQIMLLVERSFMLQDEASAIQFIGDSTLTIYFKEDFHIQDQAVLNANSAEPWRVTIYNLGIQEVDLKNQSTLCANVISPNARLGVQNAASFYGGVIAKTVFVKDQSGFYYDTLWGGIGAKDACDVAFNDTAGAPGVVSSGGITSSPTFDEWFRDVLGTNLSTYVPITLFDNGSGVYEYLDDDFHPIDGMLLGNEGDANNNYFTFVIDADFTYQACASQFFQFRGADDAWLFVDGKLAIDLGGVLPLMEQHVDMDRLGLTDGQSYRFIFFYAHRQPGPAMFRMETNLPLDSSLPTISAAFD